MPKITEVVPQKKNPKRFNVYIDGEFAFGADEDLVVNRRLVVGKIIAPDDMDKILFEAEVGKLMEKMYRWFALRQHSEKEVRDYFRNKTFSQLVVDAVIEVLKKKGLIDDLEFAKAWVEARRRSKQKGIRAIKAELFQKGIGKEIIDEVVSSQSSAVREEDLAKIALEKKMKVWKNLDQKILYRKSIEFLLRKGFDYEIVKQVLDKK
ncbi:RecX family transcriptional regulator [Candidatus Daviesbacteria bacterium]|nr:RecX family transcriptional regulator [Candidatus Daviesbacteria bacterium]